MSEDHLVQPFIGKGARVRLSSTLSSSILKISSDGNFTTSLGRLLQWLTVLNEKKKNSYIEMKPPPLIHAEFYSKNLSISVYIVDLFHWYLHSLKITGRSCRTTTSCNTAILRFRSNTKQKLFKADLFWCQSSMAEKIYLILLLQQLRFKEQYKVLWNLSQTSNRWQYWVLVHFERSFFSYNFLKAFKEISCGLSLQHYHYQNTCQFFCSSY